METYVLITAGGQGKRLASIFPKQFIPIAGMPIATGLLFIGIAINLWKDLCTEFEFQVEYQIVRGGNERFHSVQNGLHHIPHDSLVLIHDGVRPLVRPDTIERVIATSQEKGNAIPCVVPTQTLRKITSSGNSQHLDRKKLRMVQTPQGFHSNLIKEAYNQEFNPSFTDDASVLESLGNQINIVEGNYSNIKVTHPADIKLVEALLKVD